MITVVPCSLQASGRVCVLPDGYTDQQGNYRWIDSQTDSIFVDSLQTIWYKVSINKEKWNQATCIRSANMAALVAMGFDSTRVCLDVYLFDESSVLFTKLSCLQSYDFYANQWHKAINSDTFRRDARKSGQIKINGRKTKLVLKFYPQKAKIQNVNALGLDKKGFIAHSFEASMEIVEMIYKKIIHDTRPDSDPIYDMHLWNAQRLLEYIHQ